MSKKYTEINSKVIDKWVDDGWEWGVPVSHEAFVRAEKGDWSIVLTPQKPIPVEWFSPYLKISRLDHVKVLGLASGGGQQMPVLAALGADCTVLDYSDRQLESERSVADREGYTIDIIKADMTERLPFADKSFNIIIHPISNCYIENISHVWNECYRILKPGGILLAGFDNGFNYLFEDDSEPLVVKYALPYNPLKNKDLYEKCVTKGFGLEFSHTMEEQIGGQLKAGFILTGFYEDTNMTGVLGKYYPQYAATRAVKQ